LAASYTVHTGQVNTGYQVKLAKNCHLSQVL